MILKTLKTNEKNKLVCNNAKNLFNKLLSIYCNDYINILAEENKGMAENMITVIYLLKVIDLLN